MPANIYKYDCDKNQEVTPPLNKPKAANAANCFFVIENEIPKIGRRIASITVAKP